MSGRAYLVNFKSTLLLNPFFSKHKEFQKLNQLFWENFCCNKWRWYSTWNLLCIMRKSIWKELFNPFQPSAAFHIEISHLFGSAKQMTGFYVKPNTGLKWVENMDFLLRCFMLLMDVHNICFFFWFWDEMFLNLKYIKHFILKHITF